MSLTDYTQALTTQLRLRQVPGSTIGQIVAEVESHVRETGEDPVEAFGQPGSYSANFAGGRTRRSMSRTVVAVTAAGIGAWMLFEGLLNLTGAVPVTMNKILAWAVMGLMFVFVVGRVDAFFEDRETRTVSAGGQVPGKRAATWLRFLALWVTLAVGTLIRSQLPDGPVYLRPSGWALMLVGLFLSAASLWALLRWSERVVDPRESVRRHDPLPRWSTPWRS